MGVALLMNCNHTYDNPKRIGRAHYVCRNCGTDISLELLMIYEAKEEDK